MTPEKKPAKRRAKHHKVAKLDTTPVSKLSIAQEQKYAEENRLQVVGNKTIHRCL